MEMVQITAAMSPVDAHGEHHLRQGEAGGKTTVPDSESIVGETMSSNIGGDTSRALQVIGSPSERDGELSHLIGVGNC